MKELPLSYHIVLTLHNSRTSRRMNQRHIRPGLVEFLTLEDEIALTKMVGRALKELDVTCYAYNICRDHIHIIIQCPENELSEVIRKIKGKTSYQFNQLKGKKGPFWSQKFYNANLDEWYLPTLSKRGFEQKDTYFLKAIFYIKYNREKHDLPASQELEDIISSFVSDNAIG